MKKANLTLAAKSYSEQSRKITDELEKALSAEPESAVGLFSGEYSALSLAAKELAENLLRFTTYPSVESICGKIVSIYENTDADSLKHEGGEDGCKGAALERSCRKINMALLKGLGQIPEDNRIESCYLMAAIAVERAKIRLCKAFVKTCCPAAMLKSVYSLERQGFECLKRLDYLYGCLRH